MAIKLLYFTISKVGANKVLFMDNARIHHSKIFTAYSEINTILNINYNTKSISECESLNEFWKGRC